MIRQSACTSSSVRGGEKTTKSLVAMDGALCAVSRPSRHRGPDHNDYGAQDYTHRAQEQPEGLYPATIREDRAASERGEAAIREDRAASERGEGRAGDSLGDATFGWRGMEV